MKTILEDSGKLEELDSHAGEKKHHNHPFLGRPEISIRAMRSMSEAQTNLFFSTCPARAQKWQNIKCWQTAPPPPCGPRSQTRPYDCKQKIKHRRKTPTQNFQSSRADQSGSGATNPPWESRPDLSRASSLRGRNKKGVFLSQFQSHFFPSASSVHRLCCHIFPPAYPYMYI